MYGGIYDFTVHQLLADAKDDLGVQCWSMRQVRNGEFAGRTCEQVALRLQRCVIEVLRYKRMLITEKLGEAERKSRDDYVRQEARLRHWRLIRAINTALVNLGVDDLGLAHD